ncbi:glycosyltransferase family A protein [uncultured Methanobrevibacter sp.]|uniref:glycosyltransferase family 2 protein n=1 Tax=uncultured Methanobrevibacter sp. TaxID=253161 RepID=UPI0025CFFB7A|nr:glycosyltransferase family A protein [uncultured Methanobrevibacter sp.]
MYKITVVCPVYNQEKYLSRTIESILNQTIGFENTELIMVDDCSTDSSCEIIGEYAKKHENILLFESEENHGNPGFGRNLGIEKSNAEYIMFIDGDDEYEMDFCETMYNLIDCEDLDMVCANAIIIHNEHVKKIPVFDDIEDADSIEGNKKYIHSNKFPYSISQEIWSKIFRKSIIKDNDLKFLEDQIGEDSIFTYEYSYYANKIAFIDYYGYKWHRHDGSYSDYSPKSTYGLLGSYYKVHDLIENLYGDVDWNRVFKVSIQWMVYRIMFSYENIN